ncbi:MAG: hypothetical protein ACK53L_07925, partial [Pirellulaceae bacterium]
DARRDKLLYALATAGAKAGTSLSGGGKYTVAGEAEPLAAIKPLIGDQLQLLKDKDEAATSKARKDILSSQAELAKLSSDPSSEVSQQARRLFASSLKSIGMDEAAEKLANSKMSLNQLE